MYYYFQLFFGKFRDMGNYTHSIVYISLPNLAVSTLIYHEIYIKTIYPKITLSYEIKEILDYSSLS